MTLPPDRVGDLGQPYAAQAWRWPREINMWQDIGFANSEDGCAKMVAAILLHPCVDYARVKCRAGGGLIVPDCCPACASVADGSECLCRPMTPTPHMEKE